MRAVISWTVVLGILAVAALIVPFFVGGLHLSFTIGLPASIALIAWLLILRSKVARTIAYESAGAPNMWSYIETEAKGQVPQVERKDSAR